VGGTYAPTVFAEESLAEHLFQFIAGNRSDTDKHHFFLRVGKGRYHAAMAGAKPIVGRSQLAQRFSAKPVLK